MIFHDDSTKRIRYDNFIINNNIIINLAIITHYENTENRNYFKKF